MRLICPCCGATVSLEALLNDTAARQAVATALALPASLGPRLLRYIALFRPPNRSLTWDRAARLLGELQAMIDSGHIQRHGRPWAVSPAAWQTALDEMLERRHSLSLPLKSHSYLLEILAGQANQAEARQEAQIETDRRAVVRRPAEEPAGRKPVAAALPKLPTRTPPPAEFRNLAALLRGSFAAEPSSESEPHD